MGDKMEELHMTEMVLAIQNEVQSALDFISENAKEASELGRSSAYMGIERLRIKLPFQAEIEREKKSLQEVAAPEEIKNNPALRKGFLLEKDKIKKEGIYSKIRLKLPSALPGETIEPSEQPQIGEIEIVFTPIKRD